MSARVNLLPPEIAQRARARRTRTLTIVVVGLYVALLGLLYVIKLGDVEAARQTRDDAQAEVARLQAELNTLQEFAELDRLLDARNDLLAAALATEISWARVLNDLALTFPPNSSLLTLDAALEGADTATAEAEGDPNLGQAVASVNFTGYSVEEFAPGVERVLLRFNEVRSFFNAYLSQAAEAERGDTEVTTFNGTVQLNDEAFTRRYAEGLPPEVDR